MNTDLVLLAILAIGVVLLNKEYISKEFLSKKEEE